MSKKKDICSLDICSLADGKHILEIAFYFPGEHDTLEEEMGSSWFEQEILVPFLGEYSKDKTIAVIDYKDGGATRQHFGLGNSPEEAVKSALTTLIAKYEPVVASAEKVLKAI